MKKLAITTLTFLCLVKVVIACKSVNANPETNSTLEFYQWAAFISSYVLLIPIVILYYLRQRNSLWTIITALVSLVFFIPLIGVTFSVYEDCQAKNYGQYIMTAEFLFMLFLSSFQLFSWISQKKTFRKLQ